MSLSFELNTPGISAILFQLSLSQSVHIWICESYELLNSTFDDYLGLNRMVNMAGRNNWTREQTMMAFALYWILPSGKWGQHNSTI